MSSLANLAAWLFKIIVLLIVITTTICICMYLECSSNSEVRQGLVSIGISCGTMYKSNTTCNCHVVLTPELTRNPV